MESLNGVNAITIVFAALCIFAIAYRFYGLWVAQKVLNINAARETPANRFEDGKDYVPTNKYVLFGHHFAAIAAAGDDLCHVTRSGRSAARSGAGSAVRLSAWSALDLDRLRAGRRRARHGRAFLLGSPPREVSGLHRFAGN
jgi:hypothetical protein